MSQTHDDQPLDANPADQAEALADEQPIRPHVDALDEKVTELTNDLKRVQAEFINFRRRAEAERSEMTNYAKGHVIRELLTVRDNLDRVLQHKPGEFIDHAWTKSIDAVVSEFDAVLKRLGVERFSSQGQPFDPRLHEAIAMEDGAGDHDIVTEELQPGYRLGDKTILRPAVVKVGKSKAA